MRHQAVYNTHPKVKSIAAGDPWEYFDINSNSVEIDESLVTLELEKLEAEYDAQEYARSRKTDYPDIGDQLDALYHAGVFPANMAARIKETKDKYPK